MDSRIFPRRLIPRGEPKQAVDFPNIWQLNCLQLEIHDTIPKRISLLMIQDAKTCWWTQNFGVKLLLSQCTVDEFPIISVNWSWRMMMEKVFINFWWYIDKSLITQHLHLLLTKYPVFCWHHPCFHILYFLWSNRISPTSLAMKSSPLGVCRWASPLFERSRGQLGKSFTVIDLYLYIIFT